MSTSPGRSGEGRSGERRRSRERALEILYEAECKELAFDELLAELPVEPEAYAVRIVVGVERELGRIDDLLDRHAAGWPLERMPAVDRSLLRIACYELLAEPEVPTAVVIDEAVELAKSYSTEDSGRYLNGVLAAVSAAVRGTSPAGPVSRSAASSDRPGPRP
ncbi:MAG: transcription antitermination factor NusB [Acidimicrobiales bacterium]